MICQRCKQREATGYMERTVNGVKTRVYVCPECFKQAQYEMFSSLDDFGLFSGISGISSSRIRCSKCGTTLKEITDNCFVGCPNCYVELESHLKPIVRNIQSASMHIGSSPDGSSAGDELRDLQAQLEKAISTENYELAQELTDRIKAIKGGKK